MLDTLPIASGVLYWGFVALPVVVAGAIVAAIFRTSGSAVGRVALVSVTLWMTLTGYLAEARHLDVWSPPRMLAIPVLIIAGLIWSTRRSWSTSLASLPLGLLVGFQSFRILVELLLHRAVVEGVAHPTMTWSGTNWDIIPAVSALVLAPFASGIDRRWLQLWNLSMALVLVVTVLTAILAAPTPFRRIMGQPANGFIAGFPFVWLPSVLVCSAWLGHLVLFLRLRSDLGRLNFDEVTRRGVSSS